MKGCPPACSVWESAAAGPASCGRNSHPGPGGRHAHRSHAGDTRSRAARWTGPSEPPARWSRPADLRAVETGRGGWSNQARGTALPRLRAHPLWHLGSWTTSPQAPDSPRSPGTGHSLLPSWNGLVPSAFEVSFLPTHPDPQAPRALSWGLTALVLLVPLSAVAITADTGQGLFLFHQVTASFVHGHSPLIRPGAQLLQVGLYLPLRLEPPLGPRPPHLSEAAELTAYP